MNALSKDLRKQLEKVAIEARRIAEAGARAAFERLAVGQAEPYPHMSPEERELRVWLRARGRQLGDRLNGKIQTIDHLVSELAYEYWHRMLFARFLAENQLLMHPDGVPISLAECEELAVQEKSDGWSRASRYASRMLPEIFQPKDRLLQIPFAPEHKLGLEKLLSSLSPEVFTADDSLGWYYQFWQTERKKEVNDSGQKINGDTLPAVTQLFTEHYMVMFLLHNTIGAWWVGKTHGKGQGEEPGISEEKMRKQVALPGYEFEYLRFQPDGTPAAGTFPGWPKNSRELRILDPCCGSGHFLVAVFILMVLLRMQEEGLSTRDACDAVIRENLFGLEIDQRCTQIAAFALALAAWKFPEAGGYRPLPSMNIACCGIAPHGKKEDWLKLANGELRLQTGMGRLYDLFQQADELGSLIDPRRATNSNLLEADFADLQPLLEKALQTDKAQKNLEFAAVGVAAQGIAYAGQLLAGQYHLVITNVPYLGRGKQSEILMKFCERTHSSAKQDLATVFVERCMSFCSLGGNTALVTPQNWLFLTSYKKLREKLLKEVTWNFVAKLGEGGFESSQAAGAFTALSVLTKTSPAKDHQIVGLDASKADAPSKKANCLRVDKIQMAEQSLQLRRPDARIGFQAEDYSTLLSNFAECYQGLVTGDLQRFTRCFWEINKFGTDWVPLKGSSDDNSGLYGGLNSVLFWQNGKGELSNYARETRDQLHDMHESGNKAWGKLGIAINRMRNLRATIYCGEHFENNLAVIIPKYPSHLAAIRFFCLSPDFPHAVRQIDQKVNLTNATLLKIPFNLKHWQRVAEEIGPLPEPHSDDPTQWLFKGNIVGSTAPLQVAMGRLLGYRWPDQPKDDLDKFADNEGIVCLPSLRGEKPCSERLRELLTAAYEADWSPGKQEELLASVGYSGSTLEDWLRNGFFEQHCKLFHQRPFIWHIWDGRRDGFAALVNYHKLDRQNLEKLAYTYVGEWIKRQEDSLARNEGGAEARLLAARQLQEKLKLILEGEPPYDIFVRWKSIEKQPIGWEPDLNDGVRLNIRPFVIADILRKKPNINWDKDRGKNPPGSPWGEERINNRHLTLKEKREAREKTKKP